MEFLTKEYVKDSVFKFKILASPFPHTGIIAICRGVTRKLRAVDKAISVDVQRQNFPIKIVNGVVPPGMGNKPPIMARIITISMCDGGNRRIEFAVLDNEDFTLRMTEKKRRKLPHRKVPLRIFREENGGT